MKHAVWENKKSWTGDEKPLAVGNSPKELFNFVSGEVPFLAPVVGAGGG
jgi:hypothetical protein